jgi:hypothetical protein
MSDLTIKNFPRFLKALDACATGDMTRTVLESIMVLSATETHTRVFATDARILVIADVETELLNYAVVSSLLFKYTCKEEICYRTYKKRVMDSKDLFPFPRITRVIPELHLMTENTAACFYVGVVQRYCRVMEAYRNLKVGTINKFCPNYGTTNLESPFCHIVSGMMVLILPCLSRYQLERVEKCDTLSIDECLPGLFPYKKG